MIFKKQTRLHTGSLPEQRGNCFPAVIASFLEMEVEDVIQIQEHYDGLWTDKLHEWLNERGYYYHSADEFKCFHTELLNGLETADWLLETRSNLQDQYYLVSGESPRNPDINHIVIYQNGQMVFDPHIDNTGIKTLERFTILESI